MLRFGKEWLVCYAKDSLPQASKRGKLLTLWKL